MSEDPIRLQNAQQEIRDAYFNHDEGLFTLDCVPGAGKTTVIKDISPKDLLRRYVAGDSTPEQRIAVISFNRSEAEAIVSEICERLEKIVSHNLIPAASKISDVELEYLLQRIRQAPYIGTIDSFLRDIFGEIATEVGFDEMPKVGNTAKQKQLHKNCYQQLQADPDVAHILARLEAAYPEEEYNKGISSLLKDAVAYCRNRRLSIDSFQTTLQATIEDVYVGGPPQSFHDIVSVIERSVEADNLSSYYNHLNDTDKEAICEADANLYDAWWDSIDDFCTVLEVYHQTYRQAIRCHGEISHTDVAYLVDAYFDGRLDDIDEAYRTRIRQRYHTRIQSLIIDEAQDVSLIQHAALSHLINSKTRVCCAGDLMQCIYSWRHAEPTLFENATDDGEYLGIEWDTHEHRTATTTYRCVPEIARVINEIAEPALTDPTRGNLGELDIRYPGLDANRDPTDESSVHIASFAPPNDKPDSEPWVNPDHRSGEADVVAELLSNRLEDGTFTDDHGDPLGISVLFRWRRHMEAYETAFEQAGLNVRNMSENLFDCDVVTTVFDICEWLIEPESSERTRELVVESHLDLDSLYNHFETNGWNIDDVVDNGDLSAIHGQILSDLIRLRNRRDQCLSRPAAVYIEEIIETLSLRADPHDLFDVDSNQRVANLDGLVKKIQEWEGDKQLSPHELIELVKPFREKPYNGPNKPNTGDANHEVEFRTIHDVKGDENDIIVLANPGFSLAKFGPQDGRFIKQKDVAALAPPGNTDISVNINVPIYNNGLYDPDATWWDKDSGLRWATNHWCDTSNSSADLNSLVGSDRFKKIVANERAEAWRLLYVALTRARDHLVIPLPQKMPKSQPRDRWCDTIREALNFSGNAETYTLDPEAETNTKSIKISVKDVTPDATKESLSPSVSKTDSDVAVTPPRRNELDQWVPRFLNPSTMYQLTDDPQEHAIDHLLNNAIHTDTNEVLDDVDLQFDQFGPADIGTCLHDVLTTLVDRDTPEETLRSRGNDVREVFDGVVDDYTSRISDTERDELFRFFQAEVLDEFLESELWAQIQQADEVIVEQPIDGLVTVDDVEIELHGTADFVVEMPSGKRHVTDVKITLTEQTDETRHRYQLQVAAYAYLFAQQGKQNSSMSVHRTVEAFGVDRATVHNSLSPEIVENRLQMLLEE
jgi:ATP-dependent helicase/nuclease subunit A